MTSTPPPVPADDDARFAQFIADVGPMQPHPDDLPQIEVGRPVVAAVSVLLGLAAIAVALGWLSLWLAVDFGVASPAAIVLLSVGTLLVIVGGVFVYLGRPGRPG